MYSSKYLRGVLEDVTHPDKPDLRTLCSSRPSALLKLLQSSLAGAPTSTTKSHDFSGKSEMDIIAEYLSIRYGIMLILII